jgi:hypothetical protein
MPNVNTSCLQMVENSRLMQTLVPSATVGSQPTDDMFRQKVNEIEAPDIGATGQQIANIQTLIPGSQIYGHP